MRLTSEKNKNKLVAILAEENKSFQVIEVRQEVQLPTGHRVVRTYWDVTEIPLEWEA